MAGDSVESIAYAEALRAIEAQSGILESLRGRAATVLSAAALVTAFLGGQALARPTFAKGKVERPMLTAWSWVGISSFGAVVLVSLVILFPYKWRSVTSATEILRGAAKTRASPTEVQRDLARYLDMNRDANAKVLTRLFVCLGFGCVMLVLEAIGWIGDLA